MNDISNNQTEQIEDRLTKMLRMVTDQPDATKHGINVTLQETGLSISDLHVVVGAGDRQSAMFAMATERRTLRDEVRRVRGARGLSWTDFEAACGEHIDTSNNKWRGIIATHLGLTRVDLAQFERVDRVPMSVLKNLELVPDLRGDADLTKRRRTNFHIIMGELVNSARAGGMAPLAIYNALKEFREQFAGELTPNMILGVRVTGDPNKILGETDSSAIHRAEVIAMQTSLWGNENNIRAMERFILTHTQVDVTGYMKNDSLLKLTPEDCRRLRQRYWIEDRLRSKNPRYTKFSKAFALLEKRTKEVAKHAEGGPSVKTVRRLVMAWFGLPEGATTGEISTYIGQLCGYDHFSVEQGFAGSRLLPQGLIDTITAITEIIHGCDPNDADFETKVAERIRKRRQKGEVKNGTLL